MVLCICCVHLMPLNFCNHYKRKIKSVDAHRQLPCKFYEAKKASWIQRRYEEKEKP